MADGDGDGDGDGYVDGGHGDWLAPRPDVKRIPDHVYAETRGVLRSFLENTIRDAVKLKEGETRKTVTALDVVRALQRRSCLQPLESPSEKESLPVEKELPPALKEEEQQPSPSPKPSEKEPSPDPAHPAWNIVLSHFSEMQRLQLQTLMDDGDHRIRTALQVAGITTDLQD